MKDCHRLENAANPAFAPTYLESVICVISLV
jgi:hypothetical protein